MSSSHHSLLANVPMIKFLALVGNMFRFAYQPACGEVTLSAVRIRYLDILLNLLLLLMLGALIAHTTQNAGVLVMAMSILLSGSLLEFVFARERGEFNERPKKMIWQFAFFFSLPVLLSGFLIGHAAGVWTSNLVGNCLLLLHAVVLMSKIIKARKVSKVKAEADSRAMLRNLRDRKVVEVGPTMGLVQNVAIPEWVRLSNGETLPFKGYIGDQFSLEALDIEDVVIPPGLLYGRP